MITLEAWKLVLVSIGCLCFGGIIGVFAMAMVNAGKDDHDD